MKEVKIIVYITLLLITFSTCTALAIKKDSLLVVNLTNGAQVGIENNPSSQIFAVHVLIRNRSAMEEKGKAGIVDLLHRLILMGTATRSKAELDRALNSIGARVKTVDSSFIPFDDYYTVQEYSFVRFQTIDKFYKKGIALLGEMLFHPAITGENLSKAKQDLKMVIAMRAGSPRAVSRLGLLGMLFPGCWMSEPVYGSFRTIDNVSLEDVKKIHNMYFVPSNMIFTIETNLPKSGVLYSLKKELGEWPKASPTKRHRCNISLMQPKQCKTKTITLGKSQGYLRAGYLVKADKKDIGALHVMMSILSDDISFELREKEGLAYSIGAGIESVGDGSSVILSVAMGTIPKNITTALSGLKALLAKFKNRPITRKELTKTVNHIRGRALMRWIPALNRAYFLGLDLFRGQPPLSYRTSMEKLKLLKIENIEYVRNKYFNPGKFKWVIVK